MCNPRGRERERVCNCDSCVKGRDRKTDSELEGEGGGREGGREGARL